MRQAQRLAEPRPQPSALAPVRPLSVAPVKAPVAPREPRLLDLAEAHPLVWVEAAFGFVVVGALVVAGVFALWVIW